MISFPWKPLLRPHGKAPSKLSEPSIGLISLKFSVSLFSAIFIVQFECAWDFRVLHVIKFREPYEPIQWVGPAGDGPQGPWFTVLLLSYVRANGSRRCNSAFFTFFAKTAS